MADLTKLLEQLKKEEAQAALAEARARTVEARLRTEQARESLSKFAAAPKRRR